VAIRPLAIHSLPRERWLFELRLRFVRFFR
jgi:hypothetical protein